MRFYEYESKEIVRRAGIPTSKGGFATTADEARERAEEVGGPVVIKSQVLTGGPDEGRRREVRRRARRGRRARRRRSSSSRSTATSRAACWSTSASRSRTSTTPGVVWDGLRKQPVMLFSDMGGIDIEEVAEQHPDHVGRGHFSNILPFSDFQAKQVIASVGVTGSRPQPPDADPHAAGPALRRARHDAGRDQPAGQAGGRLLRRRRRAHGDGERGAPAPEEAARGARGRRRRRRARRARRRRSRSPARRSTPRTTAAWPAT